MSGIDDLEAAGQAARAARTAKTPEKKAKQNRGRAQKRRGYVAEKRVERALAAYGFKRMPMSGALGGRLAGDLGLHGGDPVCWRCGHAVEIHHDNRSCRHPALCVCRDYQPALSAPVARLEVKHREAGWPVLRRHLAQGAAHALILEEGARAEPLVVLTLATFEALLTASPYPRSDDAAPHYPQNGEGADSADSATPEGWT